MASGVWLGGKWKVVPGVNTTTQMPLLPGGIPTHFPPTPGQHQQKSKQLYYRENRSIRRSNLIRERGLRQSLGPPPSDEGEAGPALVHLPDIELFVLIESSLKLCPREALGQAALLGLGKADGATAPRRNQLPDGCEDQI